MLLSIIVSLIVIPCLALLYGYALYLAKLKFHGPVPRIPSSPLVVSARVASVSNHAGDSRGQGDEPVVLITSMMHANGGGEFYALSLYETSLNINPNTLILIAQDSFLEQKLIERNLPFVTCKAYRIHTNRPFFTFVFKKTLKTIYKNFPFTIVHCNNRHEIPASRAIMDQHGGSVIFTRHVTDPIKAKYLTSPNAIIGVSPTVTDYLQKALTSLGKQAHKATTIPPTFDAPRCKTFLKEHPTSPSREEQVLFFKNTFGIDIANEPVLCMIANIPQKITNKNHPLLFHALAKLIHKKKKLIHAMLAGNGNNRVALERLAKDLAIAQYVHFLGFTQEIPSLLHYSDFLILTSNKEAFGLVYAEAGYMKRASIGATKTGAESVIVHLKTGLLYENGSLDGAMEAIEYLMDNPEVCKQMGLDAHKHISQNFTPEILGAKIQALYQNIMLQNVR